jgi:hypothetical protein
MEIPSSRKSLNKIKKEKIMKTDREAILNLTIGFLLGILFLAFIWWTSTKHQDKKEERRYNAETYQITAKDTNHEEPGMFIYTIENKKGWKMYFNDSITYPVGYQEIYLVKK